VAAVPKAPPHKFNVKQIINSVHCGRDTLIEIVCMCDEVLIIANTNHIFIVKKVAPY
jgi:hypothetical protein